MMCIIVQSIPHTFSLSDTISIIDFLRNIKLDWCPIIVKEGTAMRHSYFFRNRRAFAVLI